MTLLNFKLEFLEYYNLLRSSGFSLIWFVAAETARRYFRIWWDGRGVGTSLFALYGGGWYDATSSSPSAVFLHRFCLCWKSGPMCSSSMCLPATHCSVVDCSCRWRGGPPDT